MQQGNWLEIKERLKEEDKIIFKNIDKSKLTDYEKRNIIFNYLSNNIIYDYDLLVDIFLCSLNLEKSNLSEEETNDKIYKYLNSNNITDPYIISAMYKKQRNSTYNKGRNPVKELLDVIYKHIGICSSISQYYKLLLEYNDIYSVCVICDNMMPKNHEINLIYDKENNTYSFDDITTSITSPNLKDKCFDYDIETAKDLKQGLRTVGHLTTKNEIFNTFGVILSTDVINYYVGKYDKNHFKYGLENNNNIMLPENIQIKNKEKRILK